MIGPISSAGRSAIGMCVKPDDASRSAYDAGAATATSCPAAAHARKKVSSGPAWPSFAVVAARIRTAPSLGTSFALSDRLAELES
jgi:hypothetical protein